MKRLVLVAFTILALTATGALLAQSPQNTTAPGPTTQQEPGQTNNNLPNPGNPVQVGPDTTSGTTATGATGTTTGLDPMGRETETGTGVDVDVDTGDRAAGAVDVDVNRTTDADTDASGIDETGSLDNDADNATLPETASNELMVALIGLFALGAALSIRAFAKQGA